MEKEIAQHLIPSLTGQRAPNSTIRAFLALPARFVGLGLINPATLKCTTSLEICVPLIRLIIKQEGDVLSMRQIQQRIKHQVQKECRSIATAQSRELINNLPSDMQQCVNTAQEKGVSSWLSVLPLAKHDFVLHNGDFRDALSLRYGWSLQRCPQSNPLPSTMH